MFTYSFSDTLPFLMQVQISDLYHFPFLWSSFNIFCRAGLPATKTECVCLSKKVIISPLLWRKFHRIQILSSVWVFFPPALCFTSFSSSVPGFWREFGCNSYLCSPTDKVLFSFGFFQDFFLYFLFSVVWIQ